MLKYFKKNFKKSQCFSSNFRTKSMIKYTSYKNLRNLLRQLLSCKIDYKIQLKNLKYLPPQSLACEVYRKQENEVKDLLPQSHRTRKINDKMQQRVVKSLFSQAKYCHFWTFCKGYSKAKCYKKWSILGTKLYD